MEEERINEEEALKSIPDEIILDTINSYLPENQKIDKDKGLSFVPEAKKLFLNIKKIEPKKEDFDLAVEFSVEGKKDLVRSKKSYLDKDFPDSIYHLQQSAEKIMKSYGLAQGVFSSKDLLDIKHKTPKAFIKLVQDINIQNYLKSLKTIHTDLNTDISGLQDVIDTKDKELALLTKEQIMVWINLSKKIDESLSKTGVDSILSNVLPALAKTQGKKINYPNFSVMKFSSVFIKMYLVSAITYPHEAYTRYPGREIKPSQYTETLGIVQTAPQIFEVLDEALDFLDKFISWKKESLAC
jgi:hypothetical protein